MPLLLPLLLASGCATNALWNKTSLDDWNEPANHPNLRLFHAEGQSDLVVVYDEYSERNDSVHTRAYLLQKNAKLLDERRQPDFVSTNLVRGLRPVSVFRTDVLSATNSSPPLYAVAGTSGQTFTIYSREGISSSHELPVYNDGKGRWVRIALTPVTVVADTTIIGGYLFLWAWSEGGLYWLH